MEIILHEKANFFGDIERFEPRSRDHTAIIAFKKCPRLFFYQIVLGFRDKITPQYFVFGKAYHVFREVLEIGYKEHFGEVKPITIQTAMDAALTALGKDPPASSKYAHLSRAKLVELMIKATKDWKKEKQKGQIQVLAVEQPFEVVLSDGRTRRGGKADQFVRWNGRLYGRDFKYSGKSPGWYDRGIDPNDQFSGYILGLSKLSQQPVSGLLVDVAFVLKTKPPVLKPFLVSKSSWQMEQWEREQVIWEKKVDICREEDEWPMAEHSCAFCNFRSVCKKGTERAQMNQLRAEFQQKPWDYKTLDNQDENS